eukprot:6134388-Amphidinium_carterae.1
MPTTKNTKRRRAEEGHLSRHFGGKPRRCTLEPVLEWLRSSRAALHVQTHAENANQNSFNLHGHQYCANARVLLASVGLPCSTFATERLGVGNERIAGVRCRSLSVHTGIGWHLQHVTVRAARAPTFL